MRRNFPAARIAFSAMTGNYVVLVSSCVSWVADVHTGSFMVVVVISEHSSASSRVRASGDSTRTAFNAKMEDFVAGDTSTRFL